MSATEAEVVTAAVEAQRICCDCKHAMLATGDDWRWAQCALTEMVDPVTGGALLSYCTTERWTGKCGIAGKNFQPRSDA